MAQEFDTSRCMFDPSKFGGSSRIGDVYPETLMYTEFTKNTEWDIKIAILISDYDSPFVQKIKDQRTRLIAVYNHLKLKKDSDKAKEKFEEILEFRYTPVYDICSVYIEMQNNDEFSYWYGMSRTYYDLMTVLTQPYDKESDTIDRYVERKLKIQKQADSIKKTLEESSLKLFGSAKMKMAVARAKMKKLRTHAERYAVPNQIE